MNKNTIFYREEWRKWEWKEWDNDQESWFDNFNNNPKKCLLMSIIAHDNDLRNDLYKDYIDEKRYNNGE